MDNKEFQSKWRYLLAKIRNDFGTDADLVNLLYLIGVQESGSGFAQYTKDEKVALITIGNHKVLSYFGYYRLAGTGINNWPVYHEIKTPENLTQEQKDQLLQQGIVKYFTEINYI